MATMQTDMKTLQETVSKGHKQESREESGMYVYVSLSQSKRGCQKCQDEGMPNACDQCFICGGSNHIAFVVVQTTGLNIGIWETGKDCPEGQGVAPPKESTKSHHCNNCSTKETVS
ncbi:Hypothetical predicted protein, partial [Paramuricea clavata]